MTFNPHDVGVHNGNIFGFPCDEENADLVIIPVPWDATASYGKGTAEGPEAVLEASVQLDFYHPFREKAWESKLFMAQISKDWKRLNNEWNAKLTPYFAALENGDPTESFQPLIDEMNILQTGLTSNLQERCTGILKAGKVPAVLGGEHSSPLGLMQSIGMAPNSFGILQLDAHADLRDAYEGFEESHASIMYNALKIPTLSRLVQVGIRDLSAPEKELIDKDDRIQTFFDWDVKDRMYRTGDTWLNVCEDIINPLPEHVYISFDIDVLDPSLCPNTGTPVAGGLKYEEIRFLLQELVRRGKKIVGFDLCEVSPGSSGDWDANVGARVLWELCLVTLASK